jgi:transcriptional regulator with XRE-family HTH domain
VNREAASAPPPNPTGLPVTTTGHRPLRVSERLKQARETRKMSHRQIADATKLSVHVIRALEEERVSALPPGIYRRSLVRAFAGEVGLDPESTLKAYLLECPDDLPAPGQVAQLAEPVARASSWRRLLAMLGAVAPLLAGVAYFGGVYMPPASDAGSDRRIADTARSAPPEAVVAGGFSDAHAPQLLPVTMLITVSSRCDLRLSADGELVVARTLEAGESMQVAFRDELELTGSNAGAVQYSINGQAGRMLGAAGEPLSARIGRSDYPFFLSGR